MSLRSLFPALIGAMAIGCAVQPPPAAAARNATLIGDTAAGAHVFIKQVDGGEILWAHQGALGTRVTITPGQHRIAVMCEGDSFLPGELSIDVQPGRTYDWPARLRRARRAARCRRRCAPHPAHDEQRGR